MHFSSDARLGLLKRHGFATVLGKLRKYFVHFFLVWLTTRLQSLSKRERLPYSLVALLNRAPMPADFYEAT